MAETHPDRAPEGSPAVTGNLVLCEDGYYRWIHELDMYRNPTIFFTVTKVIALAFGITYLFVLLIELLGGTSPEGVAQLTGVFSALLALFLVIGAAAYLILAKMYGGKYIVLFEMNEKELVHAQAPRQTSRLEGLLWLQAMAGSPTASGAALMALCHTATTSTFAQVKSVKIHRRRQVIYVNQALTKNQVYAASEDFEFLQNFILEHIPPEAQVKIVG